ncbi:hypothetical protein NDU88_000792 [Pleurodeles waltl]|uniref:Secreted protein n=1 Tax=Pleurodeles waltl TaxID=8319 RepID=A0AAV7VA14_PLEWA|nr:hypothetical protein NDU88_000792 [Pleurodeles waltl]
MRVRLLVAHSVSCCPDNGCPLARGSQRVLWPVNKLSGNACPRTHGAHYFAFIVLRICFLATRSISGQHTSVIVATRLFHNDALFCLTTGDTAFHCGSVARICYKITTF